MNITEFIDSMNRYMKSVDDRRIEFYQSIPFQPGRSLDGCIFITFTHGKGTTMHMAGETAKPTDSENPLVMKALKKWGMLKFIIQEPDTHKKRPFKAR